MILEISPDLAQKITNMAFDHDASEEQLRHTFAELAAQMPPTKNGAASLSAAALPRRESGFLLGAFTMSADFDDPLPDSFWLGRRMTALFDTHAFLWWVSEPQKLSEAVQEVCADPNNTLLLSVASLWEMQIKIQVGKLTAAVPLTAAIEQSRLRGVILIPILSPHVLELVNLPLIHKDPFDRLLIAQARIESATLLSVDASIAQYPVNRLW